MGQRRKAEARKKEPQVSFWLQIAVSLWMVGVLIWFYSDQKIRHWLAMMLTDLLGW